MAHIQGNQQAVVPDGQGCKRFLASPVQEWWQGREAIRWNVADSDHRSDRQDDCAMLDTQGYESEKGIIAGRINQSM
jgi:hypothetical protein